MQLEITFILGTIEALVRRHEEAVSDGRVLLRTGDESRLMLLGELSSVAHTSLNRRPRFNALATSNFNATGGSSGHQCTIPYLSQCAYINSISLARPLARLGRSNSHKFPPHHHSPYASSTTTPKSAPKP